MSEASENIEAQTTQEYTVTSSYLQRFFIPRSPSYNISLAAMETEVEKYYAADLVPISTLRCGCMLKNWADIPGRDASPQRNIPVACNVDETKQLSGIHNESSSSDAAEHVAERNHEEINDLPKCDGDYISGRISTIKEVNDLSDNPIVSNAKCGVENSNSFRAIDSHANECHFGDFTNPSLDNRQLSPDMFADYESSANNSLNDGKIHGKPSTTIASTLLYFLIDVLLDDQTKDAERHIVAEASNILIDIHSGSSDSLECERLSIISQIDKNRMSEGTIYSKWL